MFWWLCVNVSSNHIFCPIPDYSYCYYYYYCSDIDGTETLLPVIEPIASHAYHLQRLGLAMTTLETRNALIKGL